MRSIISIIELPYFLREIGRACILHKITTSDVTTGNDTSAALADEASKASSGIETVSKEYAITQGKGIIN